MRDTNVSDGFVPLGEFNANASKIIREIGVSEEPLVITHNGRPAAVLISPLLFMKCVSGMTSLIPSSMECPIQKQGA